LAAVTLDQSTEGLKYSASLIPYAQVDLAFRTAGYITQIKQIRSADGRMRDIGTGDYVTTGSVLAQIGSKCRGRLHAKDENALPERHLL
jgi:hypothetical protein